MPVYQYVARGGQGQSLRGEVTAAAEDEALSILQAQGLIVTSLTAARNAAAPPAGGMVRAFIAKRHRRVTTMDLVIFSKQLSTLLESGVPLVRSLSVLRVQADSQVLEQTVSQILKDVESGIPLHEAMRRHPRVFNDFWINLVKAGETSGHLAQSLAQVARYLEVVRSLQQKLLTAMIYPTVLIVVAIMAVAIFLLKIVPIFANLFSEFKVGLPWITVFVIKVSAALQQWFLLGILVIGGVTYGLREWRKTEYGRVFIDQWLLQTPLVGQLIQYSEVARFANSLSTLLESGVPILQSLEIVKFGASNALFVHAIETIRISVRDGHTMTDPLAQAGLFPPMVVQMVRAGEEIGQVAKMLERVARYYEERTETLIARLTTLFEPMVLVFMGGVIGVIVVAMYLPLFNLSQIGRG